MVCVTHVLHLHTLLGPVIAVAQCTRDTHQHEYVIEICKGRGNPHIPPRPPNKGRGKDKERYRSVRPSGESGTDTGPWTTSQPASLSPLGSGVKRIGLVNFGTKSR